MSKSKPRHLDFIVDKLTNSIENVRTGEKFATRLYRLHPNDSGMLAQLKWQFDWTIELQTPDREVYSLTTIDNPNIFHGLICIEDRQDHIFIPLIESAPFNIGSKKEYDGVPGNLIAFACHRSQKNGYDGVVAFIAKSRLIEHYEKTLGAKRFAANKMFIDEEAAEKLIEQYFKYYDENRLQEIGWRRGDFRKRTLDSWGASGIQRVPENREAQTAAQAVAEAAQNEKPTNPFTGTYNEIEPVDTGKRLYCEAARRFHLPPIRNRVWVASQSRGKRRRGACIHPLSFLPSGVRAVWRMLQLASGPRKSLCHTVLSRQFSLPDIVPCYDGDIVFKHNIRN
jgi:hypothetical protein